MLNLWVLSILKLSGTILSSSEQNADELMIFLKVLFPLKFKSINPNSLFLKSFIEEIKIRSPIWKKEHYENDESEWLKGSPIQTN